MLLYSLELQSIVVYSVGKVTWRNVEYRVGKVKWSNVEYRVGKAMWGNVGVE